MGAVFWSTCVFEDVPIMIFRDYFPDRLKFSVQMLEFFIYFVDSEHTDV